MLLKCLRESLQLEHLPPWTSETLRRHAAKLSFAPDLGAEYVVLQIDFGEIRTSSFMMSTGTLCSRHLHCSRLWMDDHHDTGSFNTRTTPPPAGRGVMRGEAAPTPPFQRPGWWGPGHPRS